MLGNRSVKQLVACASLRAADRNHNLTRGQRKYYRNYILLHNTSEFRIYLSSYKEDMGTKVSVTGLTDVLVETSQCTTAAEYIGHISAHVMETGTLW
jgi:hypothetical protein